MEWKLGHLNTHKSIGPDGIPNWILRDFCSTLAPPITAIANSSLRQRLVPSLWKSADVVPVPKVKPPRSIKSDLRPISLTPVISKCVEEFVYNWILKLLDQS